MPSVGLSSSHELIYERPPLLVSRELKRLLEESGAADGLERVPSLKVLRSSMVTALHEQGAALEVISKVTGHATAASAGEHHLAVTAESTRREFEAISARLSRMPDELPQLPVHLQAPGAWLRPQADGSSIDPMGRELPGMGALTGRSVKCMMASVER